MNNLNDVWRKWPEILRAHLQEKYGLPTAITRLYGLGHNAIWKVDFAAVSWIVKRSKEIAFYRTAAPELRRQGVPIIALEWSEAGTEGEWFVVEFVPNGLPRERWLADAEVMRALHSLHTSVLPENIEMGALFVPRWDDTITETALTFFVEADAERLRPRLKRLQAASQTLFEACCWISGDPNPMNWGVQQDGTVALFDWERFGRGTPPLDIAISMPGLPTVDDFKTAAEVYSRYDDGGTNAAQIERLAGELARAKVWNVVEYLSMAQAGGVADTGAISWIRETFPAWVKTVPV